MSLPESERLVAPLRDLSRIVARSDQVMGLALALIADLLAASIDRQLTTEAQCLHLRDDVSHLQAERAAEVPV